jgi:polar amino acid transport system permease protein
MNLNIAMMFSKLIGGMWLSIYVFVFTLLFSLPLGMIIAFGRMADGNIFKKIIQLITKFYISVMRGTPLMLQLLVIFFGPYYLFRIPTSNSYRYIAVIIGFVLNYAAYFAEIYRSGIEAIPKGQYEAAKMLGYSKPQTFFKIILPQVIKIILPSVTNEVITLVKDTSLAFSISLLEMFTVAKALASSSTSMIPYLVAGIFYYIFNFIVAYIMGLIEKKLNYNNK